MKRDQPLRTARRSSVEAMKALSAREREVLSGIERGLTNKEFGLELMISHRTVEIHRAHLMRKLGVKTLAALLSIAIAARGGLVAPSVRER